MSAQETLARMLREEVAPELRRWGMRGSGRNFELPDPRAFLLVGIQSSTSSTADEVRFTVNLAVIDRAQWDAERAPWWPERPTATSGLGIRWSRRLPFLLAEYARDHWWTVRANEDTAAIAGEVLAALRDHGLPEVRRRAAG